MKINGCQMTESSRIICCQHSMVKLVNWEIGSVTKFCCFVFTAFSKLGSSEIASATVNHYLIDLYAVKYCRKNPQNAMSFKIYIFQVEESMEDTQVSSYLLKYALHKMQLQSLLEYHSQNILLEGIFRCLKNL